MAGTGAAWSQALLPVLYVAVGVHCRRPTALLTLGVRICLVLEVRNVERQRARMQLGMAGWIRCAG